MKNKAFTLIELLVVIAIIAMIAALLIPAIQKTGGNHGPYGTSAPQSAQPSSQVYSNAP